jgi:hypothetical protein
MPAQYYPLLKSGFQRKYSAKELLTIKGENGEDIDLIDLNLSLAEQMRGKLNIFLGKDNKQKILVTDAQGNIVVAVGVVMQQAERDKLESLVKLASGTAINIDAQNKINVKYDPESLFINDKGELAFDIERLTGGEVTKNEFITLRGATENIQDQIDRLARWRYVKQIKDFAKLQDGNVGDIVQFDGLSDNDYTNGHFYKYTLLTEEESAAYEESHAEYENVTIPSGSAMITYTNKFDNSIKHCYAVGNPITVDTFTLATSQKSDGNGGVWAINNDGTRTRISDIVSIWTHLESLFSRLYAIEEASSMSIQGAKECYEYILSHNYQSGFKTSNDAPCIYGKIVDMQVNITFDAKRKEDNLQYTDYTCKSSYSELSVHNFNEEAVIENILNVRTYFNDAYEISNLRFHLLLQYNYVAANDGNIYCINSGGTTGIGCNKISEIISEAGDTFYVPYNVNWSGTWDSSSLFENRPVNTKFSCADMIDISAAFDYTSEISTTTEDVIVRRRIRRYDEDGLPIKTIYAWRQHDTQPTPDQRSYWKEYY